MLLTITLLRAPATDLGYLLGKHPDRVHRTELSFGTATVCFSEADEQRCTAALVVEVDPDALARRGSPRCAPDGFTLGQHVNDRAYAASSLLSVAISRALGSAMHGRSRERPELTAEPLPLELAVPAVRDPDALAEPLFAPLGWRVTTEPAGPRHVGLTLAGTARLADALTAVSVLLPVLDDAKHHHVGPDEADKLLRFGDAWLADHPERELITRRYLRYRRRLADSALERAARRLRLDELPPAARSRIALRQGALTYVDPALAGFDAAVLSEVIEHVDPERLPSLEHAVFAVARPATVLVTTPNREFNACYPGLAPGALRHPDHRFEWTRVEFAAWCSAVGDAHGYRVRHQGVGDEHPEFGASSQLAVLTRAERSR